MTTLAVPFLLAVGGLLALQAAANVQLAGSMRSPLGGAAVQLSIGAAVGAGAVLPVQGAINAQLRGDLEAPLATGAWSFIVAASTMLVVLAAALALSEGTPRPRPPSSLPWWGWLGGFCGAAYVTAVFLLIPEIGVAQTVALTMAGQQLASVAVDRHGLLRLPRREVSAARLAGVALLLAGVVLIQAG
jgi:transporter family-2 protein